MNCSASSSRPRSKRVSMVLRRTLSSSGSCWRASLRRGRARSACSRASQMSAAADEIADLEVAIGGLFPGANLLPKEAARPRSVFSISLISFGVGEGGPSWWRRAGPSSRRSACPTWRWRSPRCAWGGVSGGPARPPVVGPPRARRGDDQFSEPLHEGAGGAFHLVIESQLDGQEDEEEDEGGEQDGDDDGVPQEADHDGDLCRGGRRGL
jgi:hypothetical protein